MRKHLMRKASTDIVNWLNCIWLTDLPSNSKYLCCYLRKFMNSHHDIAWPSYARMIEETGLSRQTIMRHMKTLESEGWIKREKGVGMNTVYIATLPKAIQNHVNELGEKIENEIKGSSTEELTSSIKEPPLVPQRNTNIQVNKQSNKQNTDTDISSGRNAYFIDELSPNQFKHCHEAMRIITLERKSGFAVYDGSLSIEEWTDCENAMSSCEEFDHVGYFDWWINKYGNTFTKQAALTNMVCDMNGIEFDRFYDMTYLQQCD